MIATVIYLLQLFGCMGFSGIVAIAPFKHYIEFHTTKKSQSYRVNRPLKETKRLKIAHHAKESKIHFLFPWRVNKFDISTIYV